MNALLALLVLAGCAAANPQFPLDDGQWHPELDGSVAGLGNLRWGIEDGQWKPALDGSFLGRGDLTWLHRRKRDLRAVNPYALSHPLDEPINALTKNAHLIQQNTEATRNILGGGIPLDLPADTPIVAATKQAHAIAHENAKLTTTGYYRGAGAFSPISYVPSAVASPVAAVSPYSRYLSTISYVPSAVASPVVAPVVPPVAAVSPYSRYLSPYYNNPSPYYNNIVY